MPPTIAELQTLLKEANEKNSKLVVIVDDLTAESAKLRETLKAAGAAIVDPPKELSKADLKLIADAVDAYKIPSEYILSSGIDSQTGEAVLVTYGGAKVKFSKGTVIVPLNQVQITGINPDAKKRKPIAGKAK